MAYLTYAEYQAISGATAVTEDDFNRLSWLATKQVENATAGADNISKLKYCTPTDPDDLEAVKRCISAIINLSKDIENAGSMKQTENGLMPSVIASVHAGNESITYASSGNASAVLTASTSQEAKDRLIYSTICDYLKGITDVNGVNMLYLGTYPYTIHAEADNG